MQLFEALEQVAEVGPRGVHQLLLPGGHRQVRERLPAPRGAVRPLQVLLPQESEAEPLSQFPPLETSGRAPTGRMG